MLDEFGNVVMRHRPISVRTLPHFICLLLLTAFAVATPSFAADRVEEVRLYALDCGRIEVKDMGVFSDTGEYDGKSGNLADPCFLIRHPKGALLWDTGLGDKLAENEKGISNNLFHMSVPVTLVEQLKVLHLAPADITSVAFSHFHWDHTGNANLFDAATWIINKRELNWAQRATTPSGVKPNTFTAYQMVKTHMIDGDYDVFGDGKVRILKVPGHTPGSQVLEIKLKNSGTIILSGDLYHVRANRKSRRVPIFNVNRADTLASMDRIEGIVDNTHARLVVQHDPEDFESLPRFPSYLH